MDEREVFILADKTLENVVNHISSEQWAMKLPKDFPIRDSDKDINLRGLINYHAYDDAWVPDMLAGKTMDEAGRTKFDGDLLGEDPKAKFSEFVELACAAVKNLEDINRIVNLSFGNYSAREYFWQINWFRGSRAHDIAKLIGVDSILPEELVQALWEEISPNAEAWREIGVFGPKFEVASDADLQTKLFALTGHKY